MPTPARVSWTNRRGQRLVGMLHGRLPGPLVISSHGMLSNKEGTKHQLLADCLAADDVALLRFDYSGCGESEGELFEMSYTGRLEDLQATMDWAFQAGAGALGLFGSSMGGAVSYLAAARDERVQAIATLGAVAHTEDMNARYPSALEAWAERGYREDIHGASGQAFVDDALTHDVLACVGILRAPVLVLHGERDGVIPVSDAHDIATAARSASLEIVPGADHRFSSPTHLRPAMRQVGAFFAEHLVRSGNNLA